MIVDKYVPPRGRHCLLILGILASGPATADCIRCEVFPVLAVHRALSPASMLRRTGSGWPLTLADAESELREIARGVS